MEMKITLLGTSHGDPTPERFNTSNLIEFANGEGMLVDAGAPALALLLRAGFDYCKLRWVFVTHLHQDHFGGIPDIMKFQAKRLPKGNKTWFYLPEEGAAKGFYDFMQIAHRPIPDELVGFKTIQMTDYQFPGAVMRPFATDHFSNEGRDFPSFGFKFTTDSGKVVIFTGDLSKDLHDLPDGVAADLVFCELTHYSLEAQLEVFKRQNYKHLVFNHVGNEWHGEAGRREFERLTQKLPYPCTLAFDGDVFTV